MEDKNSLRLKPANLFELYLSLSLASSIFLWVGLAYLSVSYTKFFSDSLVLSSLVVLSWSFYTKSGTLKLTMRENFFVPAFFLFQFYMLMATAWTYNMSGAIYLALIPCLAGAYFIQYREFKKRKLVSKTLSLFFIAITSILFTNHYAKGTLLSNQEFLALTVFFIWQSGLVYYGNTLMSKKGLSFLKSILRNSGESSNYVKSERSDQKERFFYHDLMNQTHGINLFLNQKINSKQSLTYEECMSLSGEVKIMQSLLKDHYGFKHRNLTNPFEWVSFEIVKNGMYNLSRTYLPEHETECHFVFQGNIAEEEDDEVKENCKVHYPSFYRIFHNIVKNISEQKSTQVEFIFNYTEDGIHMTVKNSILELRKTNGNLAEKLGQIILNSDNENSNMGSGLGMESISNLTEALGGSYHFSVNEDFWVNEVYLPAPMIGPAVKPKIAA